VCVVSGLRPGHGRFCVNEMGVIAQKIKQRKEKKEENSSASSAPGHGRSCVNERGVIAKISKKE
jgi:hypothetical protein